MEENSGDSSKKLAKRSSSTEGRSDVNILSQKPQTWYIGVGWHAIGDGGSYFGQLEHIRYFS